MTEITLLCRIDSMHDKAYLDAQVSNILKPFKKNFKGKKSQITSDSDLERKYVFYNLEREDATRLKSIATENRAQLCMKTVVIDSGTPTMTTPTPPPSPLFAVPSLTVSPGDKVSSPVSSSVSSSTKSLVLNFGVDSPSPSSARTSSSFFSSAPHSDSDVDSGSSSGSGSDVGVGTLVTTPEVLILRELAEVMKVSSVKPTPSQIGKAVSTWYITERVQKVMRRVV